jgi:hypothetical protein
MNIELLNCMIDAYEIVSAWELPEEELASATLQQAYLMAGLNPHEATPLFDE